MAFERKDNSGAVFKNERKEKDTHPDRTGDALIDGKEYWVSGWIKQDRNGRQFMSLSFKLKDGAGKKTLPKAPLKSVQDDFADEVPF